MQDAIFRQQHEPLTIESVDVDKPLGREVLVRTVATGVCHSDLHVIDGNVRSSCQQPAKSAVQHRLRMCRRCTPGREPSPVIGELLSARIKHPLNFRVLRSAAARARGDNADWIDRLSQIDLSYRQQRACAR